MRTCRFVIALAFLIIAFGIAPCAWAGTIPIIIFNTGVQNNGHPLPDGAVDPHYTLIDSPHQAFLGSTYTLNSATLIPLTNFWTPNTSISKWIAPSPDALNETYYGEFGGNYTYRTTFSLPDTFNPLTDTASITGMWASDNSGLAILINGNNTGNSIPYGCQYGPCSFQVFSPLSITTGFQAGLNTLDFIIWQPGGNYTGMHVQMTGSYTTHDADGDGVPDAIDQCPNSILTPTVIIGGCNSGVPNDLLSTGCTISDLIAQAGNGAKNHGQFVSAVASITNELMKSGAISGSQKGAIQSCAAKARIP